MFVANQVAFQQLPDPYGGSSVQGYGNDVRAISWSPVRYVMPVVDGYGSTHFIPLQQAGCPGNLVSASSESTPGNMGQWQAGYTIEPSPAQPQCGQYGGIASDAPGEWLQATNIFPMAHMDSTGASASMVGNAAPTPVSPQVDEVRGVSGRRLDVDENYLTLSLLTESAMCFLGNRVNSQKVPYIYSDPDYKGYIHVDTGWVVSGEAEVKESLSVMDGLKVITQWQSYNMSSHHYPFCSFFEKLNHRVYLINIHGLLKDLEWLKKYS